MNVKTNTIHKRGCDCYECSDPRIAKLNRNFAKGFEVDASGRNPDNFETDSFAKDFSSSIAWNTEPLLANPLKFWVDWWNAKTWVAWHQKVEKEYGTKRANEVFIEWFSKAPFASPTTDFRTFNKDFITYAKDKGFYSALFSGLGGLIGKTATAINKTVDTAGKVVDTAGNIVEGTGDAVTSSGNIVTGIFSNFKLVLIVALVLVLVFAFFSVRRSVV
jgi:hypothetical protein